VEFALALSEGKSARICGLFHFQKGGFAMSVPVKLSEIIDAMDFQLDESSAYLDKSTGEVVILMEEEMRAAEEDEPLDDYAEWERESIQKAVKILYDDRENYPSLPTKWDIHEYRIMEKFCLSIEDQHISDSLYRAIKGSGAFRRFKDGVYRFGIQDDWYKYRYEAFKEIAIEWCEEREVEYIDDTVKRPLEDKGTQETTESVAAPGLAIRQATLHDAIDLARLRWQSSPDEVQATSQDFTAFLEGFAEFLNYSLAGGTWRVWVAERDERLVANIYVQIVPKVPRPGRFLDKYGYITNVYVKPEERDSGVGSQLLEQVVAWAREQRLEFLIVWPSDASVEFYELHGFVRSAEAMQLHLISRETTKES
jgi:ribosomal protein S18 acetylase RimI-like enzyme